MSYEEDQDNDQANGANGRFDEVAKRYVAGGNPRKLHPDKVAEVKQAMTTIAEFYRATGLDPATLDERGLLIADIKTLDLLREFKAAKDFKESADLIAKEAGRVYDYLRLALVPARFEEDGISNMKVDGVGRVQLASDLYAGIMKGTDKEGRSLEEKAFEWLDDNGRGDVVKKTVNSSSLKAILKGMITKGEEIPAELFKADPFTRASIVKA